MLVILYYLFLAELSYKFVDAELMECMVLSGGGGGNIVTEKHQIVMYYNNNLIFYNNNKIRLAY